MTNRSVLYIDSAYSLGFMRARKHEYYLANRHRGGYFARVWSVHPLVGLMGSRKAGPLAIDNFSADHVVIDGFAEGAVIPSWRVPLNVISAQVRLLAELGRIIRRHDVDVIFATDCFYSGLLGLAVRLLTRRPLVVAIYANQDLTYEATGELAYPRLLPHRKLEQWVQRFVLRRADWIEVPAEDTARYAIRYGADPDKFLRLPVVKFIGGHHYTEPAMRAFPSELLNANGIPVGRDYLLYVGRLSPVKYPADVIDTLRIAIAQEPHVIGLLAGDGPLRTQMQARIAEYGLDGKVFLLGNLDQQVLSMLTPHCTILSPLTGMALIETSLAGAPVVAYDREWQPEFITDGDNGFLVPFRDVQAMAERALQLVRDPHLRSRMSARARAKALEFADQERHIAKERAALDRVLLKAGRSHAVTPDAAQVDTSSGGTVLGAGHEERVSAARPQRSR